MEFLGCVYLIPLGRASGETNSLGKPVQHGFRESSEVLNLRNPGSFKVSLKASFWDSTIYKKTFVLNYIHKSLLSQRSVVYAVTC